MYVNRVYKCRAQLYVFQCLNHTNNYFQKRESLHDRKLRDMKNLHVPVGYLATALSSTRINGKNCHSKLDKNEDAICFKNSPKSHFIVSYTWIQVRYVIAWNML